MKTSEAEQENLEKILVHINDELKKLYDRKTKLIKNLDSIEEGLKVVGEEVAALHQRYNLEIHNKLKSVSEKTRKQMFL